MIIFHTGYASNRTIKLNTLILCLVLTTQQWAIFLPFSTVEEGKTYPEALFNTD